MEPVANLVDKIQKIHSNNRIIGNSYTDAESSNHKVFIAMKSVRIIEQLASDAILWQEDIMINNNNKTNNFLRGNLNFYILGTKGRRKLKFGQGSHNICQSFVKKTDEKPFELNVALKNDLNFKTRFRFQNKRKKFLFLSRQNTNIFEISGCCIAEFTFTKLQKLFFWKYSFEYTSNLIQNYKS